MSQEEREAITSEFSPPFTVHRPAVQSVPFVFCSPHSGRRYPSILTSRSRLDSLALRRSEDCYVDDIFAFVPDIGAPLIAAEFPRAYLDVNREPYELDPELFIEPLPDFANTRSLRVAGGLGTVARIVADGDPIYHTPPSLPAALERIELLYKPFHQALKDLLSATRKQFGYAVLVDCHSMPSAAMNHYLIGRPDIVIGDRFGLACDASITRLARETLVGIGYKTLLNRPYAGGFITENYGRPADGFHAFQLEINRAIYIDEPTLAPTAGMPRLKQNLLEFGERLVTEAPRRIAPPAAAE